MELREKLSFIQQNIKSPKNLYNSFGKYNYRNAESILEAFKPFAKEYKVSLVLSDDIVQVGDRIYVKATAKILDCESDASFEVSAFARESIDKKGMDDSQITGTASSYARKYALNGLFLLDDTKDADTDEYANQQSQGKQNKQGKGKPESKGSSTKPETADTPISEKQAEEVLKEMERTGVTVGQVQYVVKKGINDLTVSDYKTLMDMFRNTPDKVPPTNPEGPPNIPEGYEEGLPFK